MTELLDSIKEIRLKYASAEEGHPFNLFSMLRNPYDEVHLHSRFLYELLNPKGSHQRQDAFLKAFLETLGIEGFEIATAQAAREQHRIDVLLTNRAKQAIVIENKIWAADQPEQLFRYYQEARVGYEDIWLVYLTPFERDPSEDSIKELPEILGDERLLKITYRHHITRWIETLIKMEDNPPIIRESLVQYKYLINQITGNTMSDEMKNAIINELAKGDNVLQAHKIHSVWSDVIWRIERDFWQALEGKMKQQYHQILPVGKYNGDKIYQACFKASNRTDYWYGVMAELFTLEGLEGYQFCIYVERGMATPYYGITVVKDGQRDLGFKPKHPDVAQAIANLAQPDNDNEWWLGYRFFDADINFGNFNETTLKTLNPDYRQELVDKLWGEIEGYVKEVLKVKEGGFKNPPPPQSPVLHSA
jgi:hypothetical protein